MEYLQVSSFHTFVGFITLLVLCILTGFMFVGLPAIIKENRKSSTNFREKNDATKETDTVDIEETEQLEVSWMLPATPVILYSFSVLRLLFVYSEPVSNGFAHQDMFNTIIFIFLNLMYAPLISLNDFGHWLTKLFI